MFAVLIENVKIVKINIGLELFHGLHLIRIPRNVYLQTMLFLEIINNRIGEYDKIFIIFSKM